MDVPRPSLRIVAVSMDCADHNELARFYARLLDGTLPWTHERAAAVETGGVVLVMQRAEDYRPPIWPGTSIVHLDLHGDAEAGELEQRAVALGAQLAQMQLDSRWPVLLDPAGYPFCITPSPRKERPLVPRTGPIATGTARDLSGARLVSRQP